MKLTIKDNRERIKRYSHIKPAPRGSARCFTKCPGTLHTCTLQKGHSGPHVAHGRFNKVVAVWEEGIKPHPVQKRARKALRVARQKGPRSGAIAATWAAFRSLIARRGLSVEEVFLLVLAISMAGFAIDGLQPHLPFEFIKVHHEPDGTFPNGIPNPLLPENRASTANAVV